MRVVELSDHPGKMLHDIREGRRAGAGQAQYEDALARHRAHVRDLRDQRDLARAQRRWRTWLLRALSAWGRALRAPVRPVLRTTAASARAEAILVAGREGEQLVMTELGRRLDDGWALLRGYRNRRGEIDFMLLGPRGMFAIEVKHVNGTVHVRADAWHRDKYDRYGNLVEQRKPLADKAGRSPSTQLNEPASELEQFLRRRGQPVRAGRIVVLTHPRSRLGTTENLTVHVFTSAGHVLRYLAGLPVALDAQQLTQLEHLIIRDHRYHEARRTAR